MLGTVVTVKGVKGLSPAVRVIDSTTSVHELILKGLARKAAHRGKPAHNIPRLLGNAWASGARGISRTLLGNGHYRYNIIGKLNDKINTPK